MMSEAEIEKELMDFKNGANKILSWLRKLKN